MRAPVGQFRRYTAFLLWFFKDAFLRYRRRLMLLVAANMLGVGLQALAVLTAYRYASAVESGKAVQVAGALLHPRDSLWLLGATAVAVFLLAVVSAVLIMRARVAGASIALEYAEYCSQRVFQLASRLPVSARSSPEEVSMQRLLELTRRDANYWGQVLRTIVYALLHIGTLVIAGTALLYLDVYLTLAVFAVLAVAAYFLRKVSIRGASQRAKFLEHGLDRAKDLRQLTARVLHSPVPLDPRSAVLGEPFAEGGVARFRRLAVGQRQALESAKLIAQVAIGAALFIVLLVQGGASLAQGGNWSSLLAYVAALSFFGNSVVRVGRTLVSINRFYPPLARHARFIDKAEREIAHDAPVPRGPYQLDAPELGGDGTRTLELRPGDRAALIVPRDLTRYSVFGLALALRLLKVEQGQGLAFPWFVGSSVGPGVGSLRENLALPPGCAYSDLRSTASPMLPDEVLARVPEDLDRPLTAAEREALSPQAFFLLMCISGILRRCPLVALDQGGLAVLEPAVRERLLAGTSAAATLIVYGASGTDELGSYGESAVIIAAGEKVLGWSSMEAFHAKGDAVARAIARAAADARAARIAVYEEDDMEELE